MKPVKLHPQAQEELDASELFYEEHGGAELALGFLNRVEAAFRIIQRDPQRFRHMAKYPDVQKGRVRQFPFSVFYIERANDIWVVAIAHAKRRPGYWTRRMEGMIE